MRISREQQSELQEIINQTSIPVSSFEVMGNDAETIKFKFKANFFSFEIFKRNHQDYNSIVLPVYDKNGFNTSGPWENTKARFKKWIGEIEKELLIQLDWEIIDNPSTASENINAEIPIQERVKNAVKDGNLDFALDLLEQHFEKNQTHDDWYHAVIVKKFEVRHINKMVLEGRLSDADAFVKRANLVKAILEIANYTS